MSLKSIYTRFAPEFVKALRRNIRISLQNRDRSRYRKMIEEEPPFTPVTLSCKPLISVLIPVYNVKPSYLRACIDSVTNGYYDNYEICIADDCSTDPKVRETLRFYEGTDRIKIVYRSENGHISRATNSALELATGEFCAFLDCDDVLSPDALYSVAKVLNDNRDYDLIYSDEDKIDDRGRRSEPSFKPVYSPDTLMSLMYISHLSVVRTSLLRKLGGLRVGFEGAQDYDMTLRLVERIPEKNICHIPRVLYHWRKVKGSTSSDTTEKSYIREANERAVSEAMERRGYKGRVEYIDILSQYRPLYDPGDVTVSVVIPSKDNPDIWERCVRSLMTRSKGVRIKLVTVDNGSSDENRSKYEAVSRELGIKYVYKKEDFNFSAMCNRGAAASDGELLFFLNDDTELLTEDSICRMAGQAELPHVGAVGAKLLYPDRESIQHIGVIMIEQGPSHAFSGRKDDPLHPLRQARNIADFNYLAVTGAALMIERKKFDDAGGFDESFPIAYNDVEFCMRLEERGYHCVVRTDAVFIHYESMSRGDDRADPEKFKRLTHELSRLREAHPAYSSHDPYYNINMDQRNVNFTV